MPSRPLGEPPSKTPGSAGSPAGPQGVADFCDQLRQLREDAGSPSFRQLSQLTHFSASTLAEATTGRRLPTEQVVRAFATACGADGDLWAARLREAASGRLPAVMQLEGAVEPSTKAGRGSGLRSFSGAAVTAVRHRPSVLAAVLAGSAALLFAAGYGTAGMGRSATPTVPTSAQLAGSTAPHPASDGEDPVAAGCAKDARLIDKKVVYDGAIEAGAVDLEYSPRCGAGWARAYLYPTTVPRLNGTLVSVTVAAGDGTSSVWVARINHQVPVFTDVVIPHAGCLSAQTTLGVGTDRPLQASIQCDGIDADALSGGAGPSATSH